MLTEILDQRNKESFPFTREISKPYGVLDQIIAWCKTEMISDWRWSLHDVSTDTRPGRYQFYFDSERDFVAFTLHWA